VIFIRNHEKLNAGNYDEKMKRIYYIFFLGEGLSNSFIISIVSIYNAEQQMLFQNEFFLFLYLLKPLGQKEFH
jgi:hypothetical protein